MHVYRVVDGVACVFVICVRVVRGISALRDARGTYGFSQFDPNSFEICGMTARILYYTINYYSSRQVVKPYTNTWTCAATEAWTEDGVRCNPWRMGMGHGVSNRISVTSYTQAHSLSLLPPLLRRPD